MSTLNDSADDCRQPGGTGRPFSEIWTDTSEPLMGRLKEKKNHVKGRCARCRWLDVCGGNFRVRAEAATGDLWAPDPACYLTDEEIDREVEPGLLGTADCADYADCAE